MKLGTVSGWGAVVAFTLGFFSFSFAGEAGQPAEATENAAGPGFSHCRCSGDRGPSVAKIKRVLAQPLKSNGFDFSEMPLDQVAIFLQEEYGIPVALDGPALEDAGFALDGPVTADFKNISFKSALRLMLERKSLTFVIQDEVLLITTPEAAEARLMACVYDVRDLIGVEDEGKNLAALSDTIASCVAADSWAENGGGEAKIKSLQPGLLVISQTRAVHDEIANLLALIRETTKQQPFARPVESDKAHTPAHPESQSADD